MVYETLVVDLASLLETSFKREITPSKLDMAA